MIGVTQLPVNQVGLDLPDTTKTAHENWTAYCVITGHLLAVLRGQEEFRTADHSACQQEGSTEVRKRRVLLAEGALAENLAGDQFQGTR